MPELTAFRKIYVTSLNALDFIIFQSKNLFIQVLSARKHADRCRQSSVSQPRLM